MTSSLNELDGKVAEAAGWRIVPLESNIEDYHTFQVFDASNKGVLRTTAYGTKNEWPDYELDIAIPPFSTDLNEAWLLLEEMKFHERQEVLNSLWDQTAQQSASYICEIFIYWKQTGDYWSAHDLYMKQFEEQP